jgi:hypothetical protein
VPDALTKAFYEKSDVILVQPLGGTVSLGSVGYFSKGQWLEVTTTEAMFDIKLVASAGNAEPNSFSGKSGKRLKFEAKAAGEPSAIAGALAKANARIEISFGSVGAFVMNVKNQRVATAGKLGDLITAIRYAYRFRDVQPPEKRWQKNYAVIVGIVSAESVTALLSSTKDATAIVSGGASGAPTLAQLDASMAVSFSKESVDDLWQGPATGYAFRALKLEPSIFKSWDNEKVDFVDASTIHRIIDGPRSPSQVKAKKAKRFDPATVKVMELAPAGRVARTVTLSALGARKTARKAARKSVNKATRKSAVKKTSQPKKRVMRKMRR